MIKNLRRTRLDGWYEFYRETCSICGKSGGCMINEKGDAVVCIRVESDIVFSRQFQSWLHRLEEKRNIQVSNSKGLKINKKGPSTILDLVYRKLIDCSKLTQEHIQHLSGPSRGLTSEEIDVRAYRSFPDKPWELVKEVTKQTGYQQFPGIPGFYQNKFGWSLSGNKGIMIPYRSQHNEIVGFQIRIDQVKNDVEIHQGSLENINARVIKQPNTVQAFLYGEMIWEKELQFGQSEQIKRGNNSGSVKLVKGQRYFWLSSATKNNGTGAGDPTPVHVAVPTKALKDWESGSLHKADSVWVTEGALKADIAVEHIQKVYSQEELQKFGSTFLAIPGVNTWRILLPVMKEMGVKHVNIAIDMDMISNKHVEHYLKEFAIALKEEGYSANLAIWNENDGKGIDDVFLKRRFPQLNKLF